MKTMQNNILLTDRQTDRQSLFSFDRRRIDWIDIAKGIAIVLVIIGHSLEYGSGGRNFIFSFHMPLFFILSGYTFRIAENREDLIRHLKNNFKHLLLPCLFVTLIGIIASLLISNNGAGARLFDVLYRYGIAIIWASGVRVYDYPAIGAIWFIFSLFWAKFIMDVVSWKIS